VVAAPASRRRRPSPPLTLDYPIPPPIGLAHSACSSIHWLWTSLWMTLCGITERT